MRKSKFSLNQLETAVEALMALRWAIDRTLVDDDLPGFVAIARALAPAARSALAAVKPSPVSIHLNNALNAISYIEREIDPTMPTPEFDRLIGIADPSIERAESAISDAQALLREQVRPASRSTRKSLRGHID
ncbi:MULTISPECIES: hypothetical protein [Paraburkholderia]|uniref:hypothetical protein n=1 Tax=Paraburkholderia TaxID=1822464 RepID=UPI002256063A|nr:MULTISPECIES: hypothetical protein [Paraburkholderia]MCX4156145.1 hypothetical protein [Paraburkholderia aspalathi]MDN7165551.1 hypothetical protein [Paraburkholderia sp. SECH2]MDQ6394037.1 hypothetical protein [Paraburkholderia aspalathi]